MEQLFILLAGDVGAIRFVALLLLPFIYLKDSLEVEKEFTRVFEDFEKQAQGKPRMARKALLRELDARLYVFGLQWWLVAAVAVLLVGVSLLGEVADNAHVLPARPNPFILAAERAFEGRADDLEIQSTIEKIRGRINEAGWADAKSRGEIVLDFHDEAEVARVSLAAVIPASEHERSVHLVQGALNGFATILALAGIFLIRWSRVVAHRTVRDHFYGELLGRKGVSG